jgi:hypothetical protein
MGTMHWIFASCVGAISALLAYGIAPWGNVMVAVAVAAIALGVYYAAARRAQPEEDTEPELRPRKPRAP